MSKNTEKPSEILNDFIEKGQISNEIEKAKAIGDTKMINGKLHVWSTTGAGKQDWRVKKEGSGDSGTGGADGQSKADKLKEHLKNTDDAKLLKFAEKPTNAPSLRQAAHDELKERGVDVSHIDLTNGKAQSKKDLFGGGDDDSADDTKTKKPEAKTDTADTTGDEDHLNSDYHKWDDKVANKYGSKMKPLPGETFDNSEFIDRKFGKGWDKNKDKRIQVDNYLDDMKRIQPDYTPPRKIVEGMNKAYAQFFSTKTPFAIISGDAGVGKSFNLHAVGKHMGQKPFDPDKDDLKDEDWDYIEVGEVKSTAQLLELLYTYKDKTIIFDDVDKILTEPDMQGMLKKATAGSGKRMLGSTSTSGSGSKIPKSFEFTGKILVLTNKSADTLVKNEDTNAIYSRALKFDVKMTKKEKLEALDKLKHKVQFSAIEPLENAVENAKERDEVFKLLEDNIEKIDPKTFTSRTYQEALGIKRSQDLANAAITADPEAKDLFGDVEEWEPKVKKMLLKAEDIDIEKAIDVLGLNTEE